MQEKYNPLVEKKEGYDVSATVYLMRHPHKETFDGDISPKGEEDTEKLRILFDRYQKMYETGELEVSHSGHKRPRQAAQVLIKAGPGDLENNIRPGLAFIGSDEFDKKYQELTEQNKGDESAAVQMVIDTGDKRFDSESLSSVEISQKVAQELLAIVEQTKTYKSGTRKPIVLISHTGLIENFLVDLLEKRSAEESLKAIGGNLDFLEDLRLYINRRSPTEVSLKYRFRDVQSELSEEKLRQLAGEV